MMGALGVKPSPQDRLPVRPPARRKSVGGKSGVAGAGLEVSLRGRGVACCLALLRSIYPGEKIYQCLIK